MKGQGRNYEIGKLICELRVRKGIQEEELAWGLCSLSEFRKIEEGEKAAEKTLLDALFGRMGCTADNFSIVLDKEQYQLYELQNQVKDAYLFGKTKKLQNGMKELEKRLTGTKGGDYQFYCKMRFLIGEYSYETLKEVEKILIEMIQITVPEFTIQNVLKYYLCSEEMGLCCLLAFMYQKYGEKEKAKLLLEDLIFYLEKRCWDLESSVKIYPQIAILLLHNYDVWTENEKWISLCQKTIDLLAENAKIVLMEELLECYKIGMEEKIRKGQRNFTKLEETVYQNICHSLKSIHELSQEYDILYDKKEILISNNEYDIVYLLQEIILDYRLRAQKSQSELGEELGVEWITISRYENGKNKPSQKNYQLLAEKIKIPFDRYHLLLPIGNYNIYGKIRQIERFLFREEFILAEQLFLEIEPLIPQERAENKQYCMRTKTLLDLHLNRISQEEELQRLETAMRCTFPTYDAENEKFLKYHIPTHYEAILLNNIAAAYEALGERKTAIMILKAVLNAYQESKIREEYHLSALSLIIANYSEYLGRQEEYEEALKEIDKVLKMLLKFGKGNMIPYLIYAKGWNLLKLEGSEIGEEKKNACMKYYQQAYWISGLMKDFITQQALEKLYEKDFERKLV